MTKRTKLREAVALDSLDNPQWLLTPPDRNIPDPPVVTRSQILPFEKLDWRDFERLCLRLAACEGDAEHWQLYGTEGQSQGGIDILVRRASAGAYSVWQSKRHKIFGPADIKKAVDKFLAGPWASRADRFTLCVACDLDPTKLAEAVEAASKNLAVHDIRFIPMGAARLSEALKDKPDIVDDFFDRPWTQAFCGGAAVKALGARFGRQDFGSVRDQLRSVYENHFTAIDPGVLRAASGFEAPPRALPLARRFVPPDLIHHEATPSFRDAVRERQSMTAARLETRLPPTQQPRPTAGPNVARRITLASWARDFERSIIIGAPGTGKSALLRYLSLDLLAEVSQLDEIRRRWPGHLPVLLSFPFWTRIIEQGGAGTELSVAGVARAWFEQLGVAKLARQVEQAFEDGRVVLLVDGVDEWSNETAAATALAILHTFIATRDLPTVVTSRPQGARVLSTLDASWARRELAPLSSAQQKSFAKAWFEWLGEIEARGTGDAATRAANFVETLQKSPQIARLVAVPLLLGGLMALRREDGVLPRSRFQAYGELASRLLVTHPTNRSRAALTPIRQQGLDVPTRRALLAALAFRLQDRSVGGGIDSLTVADAIDATKVELVAQLDLPPDRARMLAAELLDVDADTFGILVERAPRELGFFHRAIQEILAAEHIAGLDLDAQISLFERHGHDPQWRDTLLFTAQFSRRPDEVERFVQALETADLPATGSSERDMLLAEIAFGEVRRSVPLTRRLVSRFLDEIETGQGAAPRSPLLRLAIAGLLTEQSAFLVRPRLDGWFPNWHANHYHDAYLSMRDWDTPGSDVALLRGFQSDDGEDRAEAARSFAVRAKGDLGAAAEVLKIIDGPPTIAAQAAAIQALCKGWPHHPRTPSISDQAARSSDWEVATAGIDARIVGRRHTDEDRDRLLAWLEEDLWDRGESIGATLARGWAGDTTVKARIMEMISERPFVNERAMIIAASALGGDEDVAECLIEAFRRSATRIFVNGLDDAIAKGFHGHSGLAAAISARGKPADLPHRLYQAAKIAPTEDIRNRLIKSLAKPRTLEFWAVQALAEYWPDDPVALAALRCVKDWAPKRQLRIAENLPHILGPAEGEALLRGLIPDAIAHRPDALFGIFNALQSFKVLPDTTLVPPLLEAYWEAEATGREPETLLIALCQADHRHSAVRDLAMEWLRRPRWILGMMSHFYRDDEDMRREIVQLAAPLPQALRAELVDALIEVADASDTTLDLLRAACDDLAFDIAAKALVRYAAALRGRGPIPEDFLELLTAQLQLDEFFYEDKRLAALAALAAAGRLDIMERLVRTRKSGKIDFLHSHRCPPEILETLADHWAEIEKIAVRHADQFTISDFPLVMLFERYVDRSAAIASAVAAAAERLAATSHPPMAALRVAAGQSAGRQEILAKLVGRLGCGRTWAELEASVEAAELLAERHGGEKHVEAMIAARLNEGAKDGAVAALCDGWPDCDSLAHYFDTVCGKEEGDGELSFPVSLKLVAVKSRAAVVVDTLARLGDVLTGGLWDAPSIWLSNMHRRIAADEEVAEGVWEALQRAQTPSGKITLATLLAKGRGLDHRLREWCESELGRAEGIAEVGLDATQGRTVLVRERVRELLVW